jgi:Domain of unknown function (DUF6285)
MVTEKTPPDDTAPTPGPSGPHDAPSAAQLVEAVREWIEHDVLPATDGRLRFHARVAANALAVVERELELGPKQQLTHRERLARLGMADDAELAAAIRRRQFDDRAEELRQVIAATIGDKLLVANPRYLTESI